MQNDRIFLEMYTHLKTCVEKFEEQIKRDLMEMSNNKNNITIQNKIFLENTKTFHYTEILKHVNVIKLQLESIRYHDEKLKFLETNPKQDEYYEDMKNNGTRLENIKYVQRQVENFSAMSLDQVLHREKKPTREHSQSSMKYLTIWEQFLEQQKAVNNIQIPSSEKLKVWRRNMQNSKRKHAKLVSSTYNNVLDNENFPVRPKMNGIEESENEASSNISEIYRKRGNESEISDRKKKEYFSDIFENCDDLIETINRKSLESQTSLRRSHSYSNGVNNKKSVEDFGRFSIDDISLSDNYKNDLNETCRKITSDLSLANNLNCGTLDETSGSVEIAEPDKVTDLSHDLDRKPKIVDVIFKKKMSTPTCGP